MKLISAAFVGVVALILSGCISGANFVSVEKKFSERVPASGVHHVKRGETLYAIAWTYGIDYRQLASANSIYPPYTIYPGQKIRVDGRKNTTSVAVNSSASKTTPSPSVVQSAPTSSAAVPAYTPPKESNDATLTWKWPANGRLIAQYSNTKPVNKGIDIAGSMGESIFAATAGTVVYAGQGLRGYGNLVIVKHNDTYLSAYAHASRILVSEQEIVKVGQKIAEIGSTGTDKVMLHFEIRQNGKPVDPLQYLPRRTGG